MRKEILTKSIGSVLLLALTACGSDGAGGGMGSGSIPSSCASNQALSTDASGNIICKDLPTGFVTLPDCTKGGTDMTSQALTGDGKNFLCTNRNNGTQDDPNVVAQVNKTTTDLDTIDMRIMAVQNRPAAVRLYVGNSTMSSNGYLSNTFGGTDNGITAGAKACASYGAGARMCTMGDIYNSVLAGKISSAKQIATAAWIYAPSWNAPLVQPAPIGISKATNEPTNGEADNCGSYTYPTNDLGWSGIQVSTGMLTGVNRWGVRFTGGAPARCLNVIPVACCM